jgi:RNase H-fold protein (predicted Holliday junction resolvase)
MGKEIASDFRKRKLFRDSVAAQVILENFFQQQ